MVYHNKFLSANPNKPSPHARSTPNSMGALSRPRTAPRLAVPPPLNLPSLRKEHERSDPSAASRKDHGPGAGIGPNSSSMRWNKPEIVASGVEPNIGARSVGEKLSTSGGAYVPPGSRSDAQFVAPVAPEKAVVLRGEEFPSLRATVVSEKAKQAKLKEGFSQKQTGVLEEDRREPFSMRPQMKSIFVDGRSKEGEREGEKFEKLGGGGALKQAEKFSSLSSSGPLPVVKLHHTSDWADDERDTALSLPERERGRGYSMNSERVQFDDVYGGRRQIDSREFYKGDSFGRDVKAANGDGRDSGSWRSPLQSRDRFNNSDFGSDRDRHDIRPLSASRETVFGDSGRDGLVSGNQGIQYAKRDLGSPMKTMNGRTEAFTGRFSEQNSRGRYGENSNNWYKGSSFQSSTVSKGQFHPGTRGSSFGDPFLNVSREKQSLSSSEKHLEESSFDSNDPFSDGIRDVNVKMFKRKKDIVKQDDLHDPVRESFEAELENILRVQEQDRQRVIEEQARALEYARKEEEERHRLAREENERRRLLEEEARNTAWRAELDKLDAAKRAEEQRIAKEEEKRRYQMEEDRRKEAANQKLLELEAKMARRQAEEKVKDNRFTPTSTLNNDRGALSINERAAPRVAERRDWEDNERMVERLTSSASSDSSSMNKYFEGGSRPQSSRDGNTSSADRGKYPYFNSAHQEQDTILRGPRRDTFASRGVFLKKDLYEGPGAISARSPMKGGAMEPSLISDDYHHQVRKQRWNTIRDNDHVKRNAGGDTDFLDNDSFGEVGWTHGNSHGNPHAQFSERSFQNSEIEGFSSFTRYRQFLRQPRVPPPPSVNSVQRGSFGAPSGRKSSSTYTDEHTHYNHPDRSELRNMQSGYDNVSREVVGQLGTRPLHEEVIHSENKIERLTTRCDSQSSVSISSPPSSPVPLSHDEMDVAGDSPALPTSADGERTALSDNEHRGSTRKGGVLDRITSSRSTSPRADDEWGFESNKDLQDQEEYGEEDDDYQDIDETHEGEYYNLDLGQELEDIHSDMQAGSGELEQVILGFNEGVEVKIPSNKDVEINSQQIDDELKVHAVSTSVMEELAKDVENVFPLNDTDSSLAIISETEKAMRDMSLDAVTNINYPVNSAMECLGSGMPVQHTAINLPLASSSSVPPIFSSSSPVSQVEAPVKLQFGLFSGPILIPPPVPAIQIGSIHMPIPMHAQINPSLSQIHSSQAPLFQFGQQRFPASLSQNILSPASQNLPFIQPQSPAPYSFNRNPVGSLHNQSAQDPTSQNNSRDGGYSRSAKQQGLVPDHPSQERVNYKQLSGLTDTVKDILTASENQTDRLSFSQNRTNAESVCQAERNGNYSLVAKRSYSSVSGKKDSQVPGPIEPQSSRFFRGGKAPSKSHAGLSGIRGKRYAHSTGSRPMQESQILQADNSNIQKARRQFRRTEFRVRENVEKKIVEPVDNAAEDEKKIIDNRVLGTSMKIHSKNGASSSRSTNMVTELVDKTTEKVSASRNSIFDKSHAAEGSIKLSGNSGEDVDAPLQSGIVRVYQQPGIEIPNDDDDFIEVKYKRRMLNDRREQREKERKAKSRINKTLRKQHPVHPRNASLSISQKQVGRFGGDSAKGVNLNSSIAEGHVLCELEQPLGFTANLISGVASAVVDTGTSSDKKLSQLMQTSRVSAGGEKLVIGLVFENNNVTSESAALGINSWDKRNMDQQVMTLTQTQLDEAMKPTQFDSHVASNNALENNKTISSALAQEKSLTPSTSPVSSLLAGEKIQFGAVTSPTVQPPVNRAPGSSRLDGKMGLSLASSNNDCTLFFGKHKNNGDSCANLEDSEAEAAASAVAVAAISNDESVCPNMTAPPESSSADLKSFSNVDVSGLTSGGVTISRDVTRQPSREEPLTVALPADLSVDTPSLSLWPSLPSPQTSGPMLSHFSGAPPSPYPCFEVNPLLGGRIFAYGPHDESAGIQGQSQRHLGIWPQCHSGVDSYYGPPTGFNGPFIGPGGISGVQGPSHMVVYNHLAPVGQFGQLGLSLVGTTYIPTGKQSEWKQNQASESKGDLCNATAVSGQAASPSMPTASIQHLGPGSAIMPMPSPLTMFDVAPFQQSADMSLQGRWSHVPAPPLHSVPLPLPLQQKHHVEGATPQLNQNIAVGTSYGNSRFNEHRPSVLADASRNVQVVNSSSSQLSDQLGVVHQSSSSSAGTQTIRPSHGNASGNSRMPRTSRASDGGGIDTSSKGSMNPSIGQSSKSQQANSSSHRHASLVGFSDQSGGTSQKMSSSNEWHRRAGFQGRSHNSGGDKNFGTSKLKQIYVAKPSGGQSDSQ